MLNWYIHSIASTRYRAPTVAQLMPTFSGATRLTSMTITFEVGINSQGFRQFFYPASPAVASLFDACLRVAVIARQRCDWNCDAAALM
jgi:hypothetical protein